jgi:multidrug efflux pump
MRWIEPFIRRPVLGIVFSLLILLIGLQSFLLLPVRQYPSISPSVITVSTVYPGAPAQLIESFVTTPLEGALGGVNGLDVIRSSSNANSSQISLQFKLGYDISKAMSDVSNAVASVRKQLPSAVFDPVIEAKDPNANPILFLAFSSATLSPEAVNDYLYRVVQPQLQNVAGVGDAQVFGNRRYAMRIWLDPQKMTAHQVTATDVLQAIKRNNIQAAPGSLTSRWQTITIRANTDMVNADQFNHLVIRNQNGYLVRLSDIGQAVLGVQSTDSAANVNGNPRTAVLGIVPLATANPLTVANSVKALIPELQAEAAPASIKVQLMWDSSKFITESIYDVARTFIEACLFVFFVIFIFLASFRATLIPLVTIPLSILGVCTIMLVLGYSLNVLTLLAWVLAIGLVVDDAIVVLENIHRHQKQGLPATDAALKGTQEIAFAIIAMTLTLAAVYAPIGFINDMTGLLFREFAFTLAAAVIISGIISLTLSPMLCAKLLAHEKPESEFERRSNAYFNRLAQRYRRSLAWVMQHHPRILLITGLLYLSGLGLFKSLHTELAPEEDQGFIITVANGPTSANIDYMKQYVAQLEAVYKSFPQIESYVSIIGMQTLNSALSFLILKPWEERNVSSSTLIYSLLKRYFMITGLQAFPFSPPALPGSSEHAPLTVVLKTTDSYEKLNEFAQAIQEKVTKDNPRIIGLQSNLHLNLAQATLDVDKDKALSLGVNMDDIANSLNTLIGQPQSSSFSWNGRSYDIIPQLYPQFMNTMEQLKLVNVHTQSGQLIPLANLIHLQHTVTAQSLNHFQRLRSVTLSGNLAPGYTLGEAVTYLQEVVKQTLPAGVQVDYSGATRQFMTSGHQMGQTFILAILFIFLVLAAQFDSFRAASIILLTVPLSIAGALFILLLSGGSLNIYTQIGLITLVGLIAKHGILIVEFANQLCNSENGLTREQAIVEAATLRLRPILMTTASMLLAAVPLVLAHGVGANSRGQLGWVILGGMSLGTLFTLFILPVIYTSFYRLRFTTPKKDLPALP